MCVQEGGVDLPQLQKQSWCVAGVRAAAAVSRRGASPSVRCAPVCRLCVAVMNATTARQHSRSSQCPVLLPLPCLLLLLPLPAPLLLAATVCASETALWELPLQCCDSCMYVGLAAAARGSPLMLLLLLPLPPPMLLLARPAYGSAAAAALL